MDVEHISVLFTAYVSIHLVALALYSIPTEKELGCYLRKDSNIFSLEALCFEVPSRKKHLFYYKANKIHIYVSKLKSGRKMSGLC